MEKYKEIHNQIAASAQTADTDISKRLYIDFSRLMATASGSPPFSSVPITYKLRPASTSRKELLKSCPPIRKPAA